MKKTLTISLATLLCCSIAIAQDTTTIEDRNVFPSDSLIWLTLNQELPAATPEQAEQIEANKASIAWFVGDKERIFKYYDKAIANKETAMEKLLGGLPVIFEADMPKEKVDLLFSIAKKRLNKNIQSTSQYNLR